VDVRLRPEGEKGPLASSLESYVAYYSSRAQPWELQALTRARPVTGPRQEEFMNVARAAWARAGGEADLGRNIDSMLERIRRERGTGSEFLDFKTGTGGMIEAEFLVQALQMGSQLWRTNWSQAVTELGAAGHLSKEETTELKRAYDVLRRCESALRRYENTSASALPAEVNQQALLARRLGASSLEVFRQEYEAARLAIHQIYQRRVKPSP
jgi:glutamate-ammonia-ligase adenylyltransferase